VPEEAQTRHAVADAIVALVARVTAHAEEAGTLVVEDVAIGLDRGNRVAADGIPGRREKAHDDVAAGRRVERIGRVVARTLMEPWRRVAGREVHVRARSRWRLSAPGGERTFGRVHGEPDSLEANPNRLLCRPERWPRSSLEIRARPMPPC